MRDRDPITRLTAARFDGPQALYTTAVRLLTERPALPDDLAGLVAQLRKASDDARNEFADQWADAEYTGERPDLEPVTAELTVERIEEAADAIEALVSENARLSACEPQCAAVKPLAWITLEASDWLKVYDGPACAKITAIHRVPPKSGMGVPVYSEPLTIRPEAEVRAIARAEAALAVAEEVLRVSSAYIHGGNPLGVAGGYRNEYVREVISSALAKIAALKGGVDPTSTPQKKGGGE